MRIFAFNILGLVLCLLHVSGCCTSGICLDSRSGIDKERINAQLVKLGVVYNDQVDSTKRDRTDWKYLIISKPGKLEAQLHWDNGKSKLELKVFDVMGIEIQKARVWGPGGLRALVAVEEPGRYYFRIQAETADDASRYALRLLFEPDRPNVTNVCHDCTEGERKCLGGNSFVICEKVGPECNSWSKQVPCANNSPCTNGMCESCANACVLNQQECISASEVKICLQGADGCPAWSPKILRCKKGRRCVDGRCLKRGARVHKPSTPSDTPKPSASGIVIGKIISMYTYRGQRTLHIEIGDNPQVRPGLQGTVLEGKTNTPLTGGQIMIKKVSGRYCIATTTIERLGENRRVSIQLR